MYIATLVFAALAAAAQNNEQNQQILAGIRTVYSYPDVAEPPEQLIKLTRDGLVGGIILFGENIDPDVTPAGMQALQDAYNESPAPALIKELFGVANAPLLITTDQEGGVVKRIEDGGPEESAKMTGQRPDLEAAGGRMGAQAADTLKRYNNNGNLAPVLDVFFEEGNFIDESERSYSNISEKASTAGVAFLTSMQENGVGAAAKHFPGLGKAPTDANTDLVPVTLNVTLEELESVDIPPFEDAIAAGVDMIMASWAIYPAVDAERPAGLSAVWLKDRLRDQMGYEGVTVSDALEAGSLKPFGTHGELAVMAASAGMDLLLASGRDIDQGVEVREALANGLTSGVLNESEFDAAVERIIRLREKLGGSSS